METPCLMSPVWHYSTAGVRSPAVVLERADAPHGGCTLCVYPVAGTVPLIVRNVPYMREVQRVEVEWPRVFVGHIPISGTHVVECWQYMSETDEQEDAMTRETSYENSQSMGKAMRGVAGGNNQATPADVFALGRRFAVMAGYADMPIWNRGFSILRGLWPGLAPVNPSY